MILDAASVVYGAVAMRRRRWYAANPSRQQRLSRPVISVGNLNTGGSGKTPVVAHLARLLADSGERPAILSRGYARPRPSAGVTVVSDRARILQPFDRAGDEPLMLARSLPGVAVVVCADRFQAGRVAEQQLAATVHILDDGFQHLRLFRDVDLVLLSRADVFDHPLPAGRLREPAAAVKAAHAVLIPDDEVDAPGLISSLGVATSFFVERVNDTPRWIAAGDKSGPDARTPLFAFAGIARPERFFAAARMAALDVCGTRAFRDHHLYTGRDLDAITQAARAAGARALLTTEKDAVRLPASGVPGFPVAVLPLQATVAPADAFRSWLLERIGR